MVYRYIVIIHSYKPYIVNRIPLSDDYYAHLSSCSWHRDNTVQNFSMRHYNKTGIETRRQHQTID